MTRVGVFCLMRVLSVLSSAALQPLRAELLLADFFRVAVPTPAPAPDLVLPFERFAFVATVSPPNGCQRLPVQATPRERVTVVQRSRPGSASF